MKSTFQIHGWNSEPCPNIKPQHIHTYQLLIFFRWRYLPQICCQAPLWLASPFYHCCIAGHMHCIFITAPRDTKFDCKRTFRILFQRKLFKSEMNPVLSFCNINKNNPIKSLKKGEIRLLPDCYTVINDSVDQRILIICLCCFLYSTKHFRCMDPVPSSYLSCKQTSISLPCLTYDFACVFMRIEKDIKS